MKNIDFRDQIRRNKLKSSFLILVVGIILIVLGYVITFAFSTDYFFLIIVIAIIFSMSYTMFSYYNSHKIAIKSVRAKEAKRSEFPDYHRLVEGLCVASGLPKPKLYIMPDSQINAFASGRDPKHAVICVTQGALEKLGRRELEGVLAHELGHIGNYDIRFITLVSVMVGMVAIISQIFLRSLWFRNGDNDKAGMIFMIIGIVLAILAPIAVYFVQASISRKREYSADATSVKFTRNPEGLIGALEKIKTDHVKTEKRVSKALAPLFFSNPFRNAGSTHPPLDKRIETLKRM
ncbi:MAG: M48 family metallopeptidase [Nanoarchaeota archaeon]|nr:M48 family metallopeptidase [Nanoarchaeota archaeon]